jgi:hypothetical protein
MNGVDLTWLWPVTHVGTALGFLLLGWRLGRESTDRPMFAFPVAPAPEEPGGEEADPWFLAAAGGGATAVGVDRNETVDWGRNRPEISFNTQDS